MKKAFVGFVIVSCLFANVSFAEFSDVQNTHWAYNSINKMQN